MAPKTAGSPVALNRHIVEICSPWAVMPIVFPTDWLKDMWEAENSTS